MAVSTQTKGSSTELLVFIETWMAHIDARAESLHKAIEFLDLCRASPGATETGALRDAHQWIETEARELVATIATFPGWKI